MSNRERNDIETNNQPTDSGTQQPSAFSGFIWKSVEQYGRVGLQFLIQILLARLLDPEAFGVYAIVAVFIAFSNTIIQQGFSTALVQKESIDDKDISTSLIFSELIALALYAILFFSAPAIARYYNMPDLLLLIRLFGIELFTGSYLSIQYSLLRRRIEFRSVARATLISVAIAGIVAVVMAYCGCGVWALVAMQLLCTIIRIICLMLSVGKIPCNTFSVTRLKPILGFGWKVLATSLISDIFRQLRELIIGKRFSALQLSFFNRGRTTSSLVEDLVNGTLQAILLPVMSQQQHDRKMLKELTRRSITTGSFVLFPLLMFLAVAAEPIVGLVLGDKWLPCVPYLQVFCLYHATWPLTRTNTQVFWAIGQSGRVLWMEIIRFAIDLAVIFLTLPYGVLCVAWGAVAVSFLSIVIYLFPSRIEMDYSMWQQLKDLLPATIITIVMGAAAYPILLLNLPRFVTLGLQGIAAFAVYFLLAKMLKVEGFDYVMSKITSMIKR